MSLRACRLTFHKDLAQHITLAGTPYHFCGLHGNTALAAFLYHRCKLVHKKSSYAARSICNKRMLTCINH